jgi:hypothetical protein
MTTKTFKPFRFLRPGRLVDGDLEHVMYKEGSRYLRRYRIALMA